MAKPPGGGQKAVAIYAQLLAAEPDATAERRARGADRGCAAAQLSLLHFDLIVSFSKSVSIFHVSLGENARPR